MAIVHVGSSVNNVVSRWRDRNPNINIVLAHLSGDEFAIAIA